MCICETPPGKSAKSFLDQYKIPNGLTQTIKAEKSTAFTGEEFRKFRRNLIIKLIYGTPIKHTPTGLVARGLETRKNFMRANLLDGCTSNQALSRSLNVMKTTVHFSVEETPFERNYGRKPRTELTNYLNLSPNVKTNAISAKPETLQGTHSRTSRSTGDESTPQTQRECY